MRKAAALQRGDVVQLDFDQVAVIMRVSESSAYAIPVTGKAGLIKTRKGVTKLIKRRGAGVHIAANAIVEVLDPNCATARIARERIMASEETATKAPRATQVYVRTEKEAKNMRGQGAIVLEALNARGQANVADLVADTQGKFETRQDPARVVGFYLSKFKREGLVTVVKGSEAAEAEKVEE